MFTHQTILWAPGLSGKRLGRGGVCGTRGEDQVQKPELMISQLLLGIGPSSGLYTVLGNVSYIKREGQMALETQTSQDLKINLHLDPRFPFSSIPSLRQQSALNSRVEQQCVGSKHSGLLPYEVAGTHEGQAAHGPGTPRRCIFTELALRPLLGS